MSVWSFRPNQDLENKLQSICEKTGQSKADLLNELVNKALSDSPAPSPPLIQQPSATVAQENTFPLEMQSKEKQSDNSQKALTTELQPLNSGVLNGKASSDPIVQKWQRQYLLEEEMYQRRKERAEELMALKLKFLDAKMRLQTQAEQSRLKNKDYYEGSHKKVEVNFPDEAHFDYSSD